MVIVFLVWENKSVSKYQYLQGILDIINWKTILKWEGELRVGEDERKEEKILNEKKHKWKQSFCK